MTDQRQDWDHYFMEIAELVSTRSTCLRRKVGAVLVQDTQRDRGPRRRSLKGSGYNGAPAKIDSCMDIGECLMRDGNCIRAVHAEQNLMLQTDADERTGATVYVTDSPCWRCANLLANSGIREIVYRDVYERDIEMVRDLMAAAGIIFRQLKPAE